MSFVSSSDDLPNSREEDWSEIEDAAGWILRETKQDENLGRDRVIIMVESFIFGAAMEGATR